MIYKSLILFRNYQLEYYGARSWNPEHSPYPREAKFDETMRLWAETEVPKVLNELITFLQLKRLYDCLLPFWSAYARGNWGNVRMKDIRYDSRTMYNIPPCFYE
jgi:hypothetical protein